MIFFQITRFAIGGGVVGSVVEYQHYDTVVSSAFERRLCRQWQSSGQYGTVFDGKSGLDLRSRRRVLFGIDRPCDGYRQNPALG